MPTDEDGALTDQPREVRTGHLTQYRARLEDGKVEFCSQKRKHRHGKGTHDHGPERLLYAGSIDEAEQLHALLDKLFNPEQYPNEVNYARE